LPFLQGAPPTVTKLGQKSLQAGIVLLHEDWFESCACDELGLRGFDREAVRLDARGNAAFAAISFDDHAPGAGIGELFALSAPALLGGAVCT